MKKRPQLGYEDILIGVAIAVTAVFGFGWLWVRAGTLLSASSDGMVVAGIALYATLIAALLWAGVAIYRRWGR